jgi:hypothetical protein
MLVTLRSRARRGRVGAVAGGRPAPADPGTVRPGPCVAAGAG